MKPTPIEGCPMKKMSTKSKLCRFTLIELLVAMGILVIIFGFVLEFFIGSQKVWTSMEQRNNIYSDARVAMDIMTTMLQNSFYTDGGVPFYIDRGTNGEHKIYFATKTMQNLPGDSDLKYVSFQRNSADGKPNELKLSVFCDKNTADHFDYYFPPYGLSPSVTDLAAAKDGVVTVLDKNLKTDDYGSVLVRNVVSFEIVPYKINTSTTGSGISEIPKTSGNSNPYSKSPYCYSPYMIALKLTLLSPADYKRWNDISDATQKSDFLTQHQYTFSRTVYLGEQSRMNIND